MKVQQFVERSGDDLVLVLREYPSNREIDRIVWRNAGKYLARQPLQGYVELRIPKRAGLNVKP